jgi:hypothetical protein
MITTFFTKFLSVFNHKRLSFFAGLVCISLASCISVKPNATKSAKKWYQSFFIGDQGTQYFIKPLQLEGDSNEYLNLDLTFKLNKIIMDSAGMNVSFFSNNLFKNLDSLRVVNSNYAYTLLNFNYMFAERNKRQFNCRFSTKIPLEALAKLYKQNNWTFIAYANDHAKKYVATKKTRKKIALLNQEIFELY